MMAQIKIGRFEAKLSSKNHTKLLQTRQIVKLLLAPEWQVSELSFFCKSISQVVNKVSLNNNSFTGFVI